MDITIFDFSDKDTLTSDKIQELIVAFNMHADNLQKVADRSNGEYSVNDLFAYVALGKAAFWLLPNSFIITTFYSYPRGKGLHIWVCGGKFSEILDATDAITAFAKKHGCDRATATGRSGWTKTLPKAGWYVSGVELTLPFSS